MMQPQAGASGINQQDIAQDASVGAAIQQQRQQEAQQKLMQMAQQQQQPAGIAGLNIPMGQFAEGGVVGFAYGGAAEFNTGIADEYDLSQDEDRIRQLKAAQKKKEQEFIESRAQATAAAMGQSYEPPQLPEKIQNAGVSFQWSDSAPPGGIINALVSELRNNTNLSESARRDIAQEIQRQYVRLGSTPPAEAPVSPSTGVATLVPSQANEPPTPSNMFGASTEAFNKALEEAKGMKRPEETTAEQERQRRYAVYAERGIPVSSRDAVEKQLAELRAFDEQTRKQTAEGNKAAMRNAMLSGILSAKDARHLGDLFSSSGQSIIKEEEAQRAEGLKALAAQRLQMVAEQNIRLKLDEADRAEASGDLATAEKRRNEAAIFDNNLKTKLAELYGGRAKDITSAESAENVARLGASSRENAALLRALTAERQLTQPKPVDRQAVLERYADNWEKLDPINKMELAKLNPPVKSFDDYVRMRDSMVSGASDQVAPSGVAKPTTQAEFDAIPKGSRYINPSDGKEYIKN
jgi:hypothetical protein